jgi:lysozyme
MKPVKLALFLSLTLFSSYSFAMGSKKPAPTPTPAPSKPTPAPTTPSTGKEFDRAWNNKNNAIIIDAYEGNSIDWNKMATDPRTVAVIHRSAYGLREDKLYRSRREIARQRGYLWGAYHLGTRGNTIAQAKAFVDLVGNDPDTLMILDLEDTNQTKFMSIEESLVFMEYVYEKTGRIPVVYANHATTVLLNSKVKNHHLMKRSKLWYARFKSTVTDFPKGIWNTYFMWQFSSEINCSKTGTCLYNVPGTLYDMDVNVFHGTARELESQWHNY